MPWAILATRGLKIKYIRYFHILFFHLFLLKITRRPCLAKKTKEEETHEEAPAEKPEEEETAEGQEE